MLPAELGEMPAEVLDMTLEYIGPYPYLIIVGESRQLMERLRSTGGNRCERLDLTETIYQTKIKYQNIPYMSRLSNTPSSEKTSPEESLTVPLNTQRIILSKDHMGIRNMQFLNKNSDPSKNGSPWYEIIEISGSISDMKADICHNVNSFLRPFSYITVMLKENQDLFLRSFQLHSDNTRNTETV